MSVSSSLLPEFDQEMATTRRCIERIPQEKLDYKPHDKSWSMAELTNHLSTLPTWTGIALNQDEFDLVPADDAPAPPPPVASVQDALERFDTNVADARKEIENASDGAFMANWTLLNGGQKLFSMPKVAVLRSFVMNHIIHHRAQLGMYLRLTDTAVPSIYGPSADENPFG